MEIKFFTDTQTLDLSKQKLSIQDSNSKMSDKMFSKFTFPFEIYIDEEFIKSFGDFESDEAFGLENSMEGFLLFENKIHDAKLSLLSVEGKLLTLQIDFGFEDLPSFTKKLSELSLEKFPVPDIHTFAKTICGKKYPETNFNFPRIYSTKYSPDNEVWDAFDGYFNDLKTDGSEMRRNYIDGQGSIFNVNIIQPFPYLIYVLKTGFLDAGFDLQGDILSDPVLAQKCIFSGTDYFVSKQQRRYDWVFSSAAHDVLFEQFGAHDYAQYEKFISIEKIGKYKIAGNLTFFKAKKMLAIYKILLNGNTIWEKTVEGNKDTILQNIPLNFEFNNTVENSDLELFIYTQYHPDWTHEMANLAITSNALEDVANSTLGDDTGVVTNLNEINLPKAVPVMTFGDLINIIRNWFNYDLTIAGKTVLMNKLGEKEPTNIKDFTKFEVKIKKKNLLAKKSFLLKFADLDDDVKLDSMYYDKEGTTINKEAKEETTTIEINGYALPVALAKPGGYTTAIVKKDSEDALQIVHYDGLIDGQNNAKTAIGCNFPDLFYSHWQKWLRQRIKGNEYNWKFKCAPEEFDTTIKDYIFAYKNIHNIKTWTKDIVGDSYEIDLTTESII